MSLLYHRTGIVPGLQQTRNEVDLVGADERRRLLQAEIRQEPRRYDVRELLPPFRRIRLPGQRHHGGPLLVPDAVQGEQIADITFLSYTCTCIEPCIHTGERERSQRLRPAGVCR